MPCYLFTYHGYLTWLPDRPEGHVRRKEGVCPQDIPRSGKYRQRATEEEVRFRQKHQQLLVDEAHLAAEKQDFRLHYIATETTHLHVLISWQGDRPWLKLRTAIRQSFTRRLNRELKKRTWFSDGSSRKKVEEQSHFDYLMASYLPKHSGLKWKEGDAAPEVSAAVQTDENVGPARAVGSRLSSLLIVAVVSRYDDAFEWTRSKTTSSWSKIALQSDRFDFSETDYYEASMGTELKKQFFAYEQLIDPASLADIKRITNAWEEEFAETDEFDVPRPLNLDPGYITLGKLVLASTKDHAHRIYLRDGIYAEVTLHFRSKSWQISPWTYPDYQREDFQAFFSRCREYLKGEKR